MGETVDNQQLVHDHLPFVRAIATRIKEQLPKEVELDDLVAYGVQGMLEAATRFDHRHGTQFTTFAYYRVRGAIFDGLRGMGWLRRGEYSRLRFEEKAAAYLAGLEARDRGLRRFQPDHVPALEDDLRDLADALSAVATVFVTALTAEHTRRLRDPAPEPLIGLQERELSRRITAAIDLLPDKERRMIELYYFDDKTLSEAGQVLGLSKSWASRLHARAVELLRQELLRTAPDDALLDDFLDNGALP